MANKELKHDKTIEQLEKEHKVIEIIKNRFTIQFDTSDISHYYGIMQIGINPIYIRTKEEFEMLKEVLE